MHRASDLSMYLAADSSVRTQNIHRVCKHCWKRQNQRQYPKYCKRAPVTGQVWRALSKNWLANSTLFTRRRSNTIDVLAPCHIVNRESKRCYLIDTAEKQVGYVCICWRRSDG